MKLNINDDLENIEELKKFLNIFNYSNMFGYNGDNIKQDIKDIKKFLNKQLKDFKGVC